MSALQLFDLNGEQRFTGTSVGGLQTATVRLSRADILALDTTPVTVVAGAAGYAIVPCVLILVIKFGTVAYTGSYNSRLFVGPTFGGSGWGTGSVRSQAFNATTVSAAMIQVVDDEMANDFEPLTLLDGQPCRTDTDAAVATGDGTAVFTLSYFLAPLT